MNKYLIGLVLVALVATGAGCGESGSSTGFMSKAQDENREPENPYSPGTGHYAGFEWAERTDGSCNGNSSSFNEGCEEYHEQVEKYLN